MKIHREITEATLNQFIYPYMHQQRGLKIEVKSKQNHKSEWEQADFRATCTGVAVSKILVTFRRKRAVSQAASMLITYPGTDDAFIARVREHLSEARTGITAIWDMSGARHVVTRLKSGCLHTSSPLR